MRIAHLAFIVVSTLGLGACGFLPPSQQQQFAVSGAVAQSPGTFRNTDPQINDRLAQQLCAEGYDKLGAKTLPADPGSLEEWQVQCAPHDAWAWLTL